MEKENSERFELDGINGKDKDSTIMDETKAPLRDADYDVTVAINPESTARPQTSGIDELQYGISDTPPWYLCGFLGFQHYLIMFGATLVQPLVLMPFLCIGDTDDDNLTKSYIIGTIFFVSGISTLLQTSIGLRLPIVQGGTFTFIAPAIAILSLPQWQCPVEGPSILPNASSNWSNGTEVEPAWQPRIREIQGAIMVSSLAQVIIGSTGIVGFMLRFIGPLAVAPTISLIGLGLFDVASGMASRHWWISFMTVGLIVIFSQYLKNVSLPVCGYKKGEGCTRRNHGFELFKLFPVLLAITISWLLCGIFTVTDVFPNNSTDWQYEARTDTRIQVLYKAPYFRVPYPGQWGRPTVSTGAVLGMLAGVLASMIESVGDYYACARMARVPPPPMHAVNRGILMEGIGCILAGAFGTGTGTTSYSENIGAIGITKNASLRVLQYGAVVMMFFGVFGKFGALFVTIPDPIVGGVFIVTFGMITAVGLTSLQFVDLNSSRNIFILGFSIFVGLMVPKWMYTMQGNPDVVNTGSGEVDQIIRVLLSTPMFVGGFAGFFLDNTIPGTDEERGIIKWREQKQTTQEADDNDEESSTSCYDIPYVTKYMRRHAWTRYIPFLPTFDENLFVDSLKCGKCCKKGE